MTGQAESPPSRLRARPRKHRWQGHRHPVCLPRALSWGQGPPSSCGTDQRLKPITWGPWGAGRLWGLASGCGRVSDFSGAPAELSSPQTTCWAPAAQTLGGLSSPGPGLGAPAFHRNLEQAAEWAVIGRRAGLPVVAGAVWVPAARWAGTAPAVTHQPGWVETPGRSRGQGWRRMVRALLPPCCLQLGLPCGLSLPGKQDDAAQPPGATMTRTPCVGTGRGAAGPLPRPASGVRCWELSHRCTSQCPRRSVASPRSPNLHGVHKV